MSDRIFVECAQLNLEKSLREKVHQQAQSLLSHPASVTRVNIWLECRNKRNRSIRYLSRIAVQLRDSEIYVNQEGDSLLQAVQAAIVSADRQLKTRAPSPTLPPFASDAHG